MQKSQGGYRKIQHWRKSQKSQGVTPENEKSGTGGPLAEWRAAISVVRSDLPDIVKLKRESLRFLDSPDAFAAVETIGTRSAYSACMKGELPKCASITWGLVLFLAWGVHSCTVENNRAEGLCSAHSIRGSTDTAALGE